MTVGPDFVYIAIPRAASTAMARWLRNFGGYSDGQNHHARTILPEHRGKFTFTIVRNPYDRMLSIWHHLREADTTYGIKNMSFPVWMDFMQAHWGYGGWNQTRILEGLPIARILRYEDLPQAVYELSFGRDLYPWPLERVNASSRRPWSEECTATFAEIINRHSEPDFERFGYEKLCV